MGKPWPGGLAAGGCGVVIGAVVVGCGGFGAVAFAGVAMVTAGWEAAARTLVESQTAGEVSFDTLSIGFGEVVLGGFTVRTSAGDEVVRIDELRLGAGVGAFREDPVRMQRIDANGVHLALTRDDAGWRWPEATRALLEGRQSTASYDWPALEAELVSITGLTAAATTPDGTLSVSIADAEAEALVANLDAAPREGAPPRGLAWSFRSGALGDFVATDDGREWLRADRVDLGADRTLAIDGGVLALALTADRAFDLPPVIVDAIPTWFGGRAPESDAPWFGVEGLGEGLPWTPDRLTVTGSELVVTDAGMAPPYVWSFGVTDGALGPVAESGAEAPIACAWRLAGGDGKLDGTVTRDGLIRFDLDYHGGNARAFEPYLRAALRKMAIALDRGVTGASLATEIDGSQLTMRGGVTWTNVRFVTANHADTGSKLATLGSRIVMANDDEPYRVPVNIRGDLADPAFDPVQQVGDGLDDALKARAKGIVDGAVGKVQGAVGKVKDTWHRVFRSGGD